MSVPEEALESLKRMQEFDPAALVQERKLGSAKNFAGVVAPAQRLIDLYKRLSDRALEDFPENKLKEVQQRANADYNIFEEIEKFDPDRSTADRDALINQVTEAYQPTFTTLHPLIAYSLHRSADFQRLDSEARATLQTVRDQAKSLTDELEQAKSESQRILDEVRATAAEAGVSQQAEYFKAEADEHDERAEQWRARTIKLAWGTGAFAVLSLVVHKIPWIAPATTYDTIQIAVSKVLIFVVLSYMLYLAAKNFLSHQHNAIVNRHRQQALQTYQKLVDAAGEQGKADIILTHAAACIFGPQATGYAQDTNGGGPSAQTVIELLGTATERAGSAT